MSSFEKILDFLRNRESDMFVLLKSLVETQSHSHNKAGNDRVAALIEKEFKSASVTGTLVRRETSGNHLLIRSVAVRKGTEQVLLVGHTDTVFPENSPFRDYREDERYCYGPGVIDMKGGLAAGIFALKALETAGFLHQIPITFIFNSDEEIGSRTSSSIIRKEARKSLFAFVLECGGLEGQIVTGRKGNMSVRMETFGKAGHAATAGKDKRSAILEMAYKIISIENLNDPSRKITANAGKVAGGVGPNTIPDYALLGADVRYESPQDCKDLKAAIEKIAATTHVPGVFSKMRILSGRPPMPQNVQNQKLFEMVKKVAADLNLDVKEEFRAGVSDANLIADENTPVLDGLGPIGAEDHSENEYMVKKSLLDRTALLACSILKCWQNAKKP